MLHVSVEIILHRSIITTQEKHLRLDDGDWTIYYRCNNPLHMGHTVAKSHNKYPKEIGGHYTTTMNTNHTQTWKSDPTKLAAFASTSVLVCGTHKIQILIFTASPCCILHQSLHLLYLLHSSSTHSIFSFIFLVFFSFFPILNLFFFLHILRQKRSMFWFNFLL